MVKATTSKHNDETDNEMDNGTDNQYIIFIIKKNKTHALKRCGKPWPPCNHKQRTLYGTVQLEKDGISSQVDIWVANAIQEHSRGKVS